MSDLILETNRSQQHILRILMKKIPELFLNYIQFSQFLLVLPRISKQFYQSCSKIFKKASPMNLDDDDNPFMYRGRYVSFLTSSRVLWSEFLKIQEISWDDEI